MITPPQPTAEIPTLMWQGYAGSTNGSNGTNGYHGSHKQSARLPTHLDLPCEDGTFVKNFQEHPQSILLTEAIQPVLDERHPDGQYCIGQDSGIYWKITQPPLKGAEAPDWFYVANVPPTLDGGARRSYVLWQERVIPLIVLEFVSGTGKEERDRTPNTGKFWVYEQAIGIPFYGIYEVRKSRVEMYELQAGRYQLMTPNAHGHYSIPPLDLSIGIWQGTYRTMTLPWLRWFDLDGQPVPTDAERTAQERQRAIRAEERAEKERQRAEKLAAQLRALGIDV